MIIIALMDDLYTMRFVNKTQDIQDSVRPEVIAPSLLYEMMRSFSGLAETLNLSQAVEELGSTRQTVRRHIAQLEEAMGFKLFDVQQRRYVLTDRGARALAPARVLLDQGLVWYRGQFEHSDGMLKFSYEDAAGWFYHQQQQPMSVLWSGNSGLLPAAAKAWVNAEGHLEHAAMSAVRPYILVYRENIEGWICVEVGEKSMYTQWSGWAQARSSLGRSLNSLPGGDAVSSLVDAPFQEIAAGHGMRLDQILTKLPYGGSDGPLRTIAFDRLLASVELPDGSRAVASFVDRACAMRIMGKSQDVLKEVPDGAEIDFEN